MDEVKLAILKWVLLMIFFLGTRLVLIDEMRYCWLEQAQWLDLNVSFFAAHIGKRGKKEKKKKRRKNKKFRPTAHARWALLVHAAHTRVFFSFNGKLSRTNLCKSTPLFSLLHTSVCFSCIAFMMLYDEHEFDSTWTILHRQFQTIIKVVVWIPWPHLPSDPSPSIANNQKRKAVHDMIRKMINGIFMEWNSHVTCLDFIRERRK